MKKERFEAFTDAVLAIILTILTLELRLPEDNHSINALISVVPQFVTYIFTFLSISTMWINHHYLFVHVKEIDNRILWYNIILLFWVSLLPATTAWVGSDILARVPAILYAVNILLYNMSFAFLRNSVTKKVADTKSGKIINRTKNLEWISFFINFISLLITFFIPPFVFVGITINMILWSISNFKN
ncbi:TMEM175 family protein [Companilactobacillus allii]|uniref:DUF1211 domain-containing membrane protein n=1 Tax=Companilactobacillus allii TaxID=1847728 RepID=A0A1P8Q0T1_9LACO|nr:TMEM175 family protein [Companilactobacillus allii]APX71478.1 hypothetical protein BTM29_02410 [Companilactobacillus allii]USQ68557.1 TMEM175 family protein [Companilactobacillus allii]